MKDEHPLNSITHLIGAVIAFAGAAILIVFASLQGDAWKIVSFSVYGLSLFALYLTSTLYHALHGRQKARFRTLDHVAIYLLIAGTYTPLTLVTLRGGWGWAIFGTVWGLAAAGILLDSLAAGGRRILPVSIYLVMGWNILIAFKPLVHSLSAAGFSWLLAGGLFYTFGILFYALGEKRPLFHVVWHLFVLAGSICHYIMVFVYIL
jgi:hemolysin III